MTEEFVLTISREKHEVLGFEVLRPQGNSCWVKTTRTDSPEVIADRIELARQQIRPYLRNCPVLGTEYRYAATFIEVDNIDFHKRGEVLSLLREHYPSLAGEQFDLNEISGKKLKFVFMTRYDPARVQVTPPETPPLGELAFA